MDTQPLIALTREWISSGTNQSLPHSRELLIRELHKLCLGNDMVSRERVKEGLKQAGIIDINGGGVNYDNSITMDQVLAVFENEEKEKGEDVSTSKVAEKVARWIRSSCLGDLFFMEKDFDDYIDSLIEKPSIVSLVQELIKEGIVEVQANNYVNYPHLKEEAAEAESERPPKKLKTISTYDYDIKIEEDDDGEHSESHEEDETNHENTEGDNEEGHGENENEKHQEDEADTEKERDNSENNETNEEKTKHENVESRDSEDDDAESTTVENKEEKEKKEKERVEVPFVDKSKEPSKYTFKDMEFNEKVLAALQERGMETCTNVQAKLIPAILDGKHIICQSPAGSGKTIGCLVTLLQRIDPKHFHVQVVIATASDQTTNHVTSILEWLCPLLDLRFRTAEENGDRFNIHVIVGNIAIVKDLVGKKSRDIKTVVFLDAAQLFSEASQNSTFSVFRDCQSATQVVCIGQNLEKPTRRVLDNFQTTFLHSKFTSIFFPSSSSDELFFPFVHAHHFINCSYRGGEITEMMRIIKEEKEVVGKKIIVMATKRADCEEAYKELSRKMSVGYVKLGLVKQEISSLLEKFRESDMNILVVQGGVHLGDITSQVVINLAMQPIPVKYLQRTKNCGKDGAAGVIYNIVPFGDSEKILIVRDKYNI